jgi:hypothetical protein
MPWIDVDLISEPLTQEDLEPLIQVLLVLAPASRFNLLNAIAALNIRGVGGQLRVHIDSKGEIEVEFFGLTPASKQMRTMEGS